MLILLILFLCVDFSNFALNILLAITVWGATRLRQVSFKFMFILSLSDTAVGLIGLIHHGILANTANARVNMGSPMSVLKTILRSLVGHSSRYLFIMAVDRAIHMMYLTNYATVMTKRVYRSMVFGNFVFFLIEMSPLIFPSIFEYHFSCFAIFHTVALGTVAIIYTKVYFSVKNRVRSFNFDSSNVTRVDRGLRKGILVVLVTATLCILPTLSIYIASLFDKNKKEIGLAGQWAHLILLLNSSLNAIILLVFNRQLRTYVKGYRFSCNNP